MYAEDRTWPKIALTTDMAEKARVVAKVSQPRLGRASGREAPRAHRKVAAGRVKGESG